MTTGLISSALAQLQPKRSDDDKALLVNEDLTRANLLLLTRLVVRGLLESVMREGKEAKRRQVIDAGGDHGCDQLIDTFIMLERVLRHGLKGSKSGTNLLGIRPSNDQQVWRMIERCSTKAAAGEAAKEALDCIRELPTITSVVARVRAWIRLSFMQKRTTDCFQLLSEDRAALREFYEPWALLRDETSGVILTGSLVGLRVLDCNLYLSEDELANQRQVVDLAVYIKLPTVPLQDSNADAGDEEANMKENEEAGAALSAILDQKNYLEERNRHLLQRVDALQQQIDRRPPAGSASAVVNNNGDDFVIVEANNNNVEENAEDRQRRADAEANATRQREMETAMALLEKDVHEKQDTVITLRRQLDEIRKINLDLYAKMRTQEDSNKQKDKSIRKLETAQKQMEESVASLGSKASTTETKLRKNEQFVNTLQQEVIMKTELVGTLQSELEEARTQKVALEESRSAERLVREEMQTRLVSLQNTEKYYLDLQDSYSAMCQTVQQYERTLSEMGVHLQKSKLQNEDLKDIAQAMSDAEWKSDKEVGDCPQCKRAFSVARRRHHCRNCGGIFCKTCSENTMALPSSAKPVRVCDTCYALLLKRYSVHGTRGTGSTSSM